MTHPSQQTQAAQGLENALNLLLPLFVRFAEGGGEGGGIGAVLGDALFDKGNLFGEFGGPGLGGRDHRSGAPGSATMRSATIPGRLFDPEITLRHRSRCGILILGPQPADEAAFLFGGALVVEGDEAGEELLLEGLGFGAAAGDEIGEGHRRRGEIGPAVGGKDGAVDLVVELLQQGDEAVVVDRLLLRGEGLAAARGGEHVVEAGEGERRMQRLLPLAVRIEPLPEIATERFYFATGGWKSSGCHIGTVITDQCGWHLNFVHRVTTRPLTREIEFRVKGGQGLELCGQPIVYFKILVDKMGGD